MGSGTTGEGKSDGLLGRSRSRVPQRRRMPAALLGARLTKLVNVITCIGVRRPFDSSLRYCEINPLSVRRSTMLGNTTMNRLPTAKTPQSDI